MSLTFEQFRLAVQGDDELLRFTEKEGKASKVTYAGAEYRVWEPTTVDLSGPCYIYSLISKVDVVVTGRDVHASVKMDFDSRTGRIRGIFVSSGKGDDDDQLKGVNASYFVDDLDAANFADDLPELAAAITVSQIAAKIVDLFTMDNTGAVAMFPHIIANKVVGTYLVRVHNKLNQNYL
ncbi:hypothetical protein [Pseudoalteromonas umbrosa]|uniref:hypothetical protein n=1 Tax=Pseudoalteromonas umbrosa TaxID=3048489 RepID=UPI0024C3578B|nr:hypothetical protein [Pseudoalteromonas sp. B95]MDK1285827.1 hypothetical protein [Pseudoalteromonas sp. B95]